MRSLMALRTISWKFKLYLVLVLTHNLVDEKLFIVVAIVLQINSMNN